MGQDWRGNRFWEECWRPFGLGTKEKGKAKAKMMTMATVVSATTRLLRKNIGSRLSRQILEEKKYLELLRLSNGIAKIHSVRVQRGLF